MLEFFRWESGNRSGIEDDLVVAANRAENFDDGEAPVLIRRATQEEIELLYKICEDIGAVDSWSEFVKIHEKG